MLVTYKINLSFIYTQQAKVFEVPLTDGLRGLGACKITFSAGSGPEPDEGTSPFVFSLATSHKLLVLVVS